MEVDSTRKLGRSKKGRKLRFVMNDIPVHKFFIVSACAVRVCGTEVEIVHGNDRLIMLTREEARELAMQQALGHGSIAKTFHLHHILRYH